MKRLIFGAGLALLLAAAPALTADKDKKGDRPSGKGQQDITPLVQAGEVTGRLARLSNGRTFTLQIMQTAVLPQGGARPAARGKGALRPGGQPNHRVVPSAKNYDLEVDDDVTVRVLQLPLKFDEKGKPVKHTAEELKELKGPNPSLPGYAADYEGLKVGQIVHVRFGHKKPAAKGMPDGEPGAKPADHTPRVTMIVVLADGDSSAPGRNKDLNRERKKK